VDHFGNVITNFSIELVSGSKRLTLDANGSHISKIFRTFGEAELGDPFLYFGSSGYIEVAINRGNAGARLGVRAGDPLGLTLDI
jgi:hypothetical protein